MRPRIRVKAPSRLLGIGVPDDAQPGDLVVGNRGAAAICYLTKNVLHLEYVGNISRWGVALSRDYRKVHDLSGGILP